MSFHDYNQFKTWWDSEIKGRWDDWTPADKTTFDWFYAFRKSDKNHLTEAVQKHAIEDSPRRPMIRRIKEMMNIAHPASQSGYTRYVFEPGTIVKSFNAWTAEAPKTRNLDFRQKLIRLLPSYSKIDSEAAKIVELEDLEQQRIDDADYEKKISKRKQTIMGGFDPPDTKNKFDGIPF